MALITVAFVAGLTVVSIRQIDAPQALPADAPEQQFSAARAAESYAFLAQRPHPIGSAEQVFVRRALCAQLRALGLDVQVQRREVVAAEYARSAGTVHNIIAVLPGSDTSNALLLVAHYDTVPAAPGAADDGSGVVVLLETARALRAAPQLRNDVIFLFTDGEERGLLGAQAFVDDPAWSGRVGVALNFDSPGSSGPSLMYETSADDGWLVRQFALAAPRPVTSSLLNAASRDTWVESDFTPLRTAGLAGMSFASLDGAALNHTGLDDRDHLDLDAVQHAGDYAVALAQHLGALELTDVREPDVVFFTAEGSRVVIYGEWLAGWLVVAAAAGFVAAVWWARRRRLLTLNGVAIAATVALLTTLAALVLTAIAWVVVRDQYYQGASSDDPVLVNNLDRLGLVLLGLAAAVGIVGSALRRMKVCEVVAGGLVWWLVLAALADGLQAGAGYLFVWPLLFALAGFAGVIALLPRQSCPQSGPGGDLSVSVLAAAACGVAPGLMMLSSVAYLFLLSAELRLTGTVVITSLAVFLLAVPVAVVCRPSRLVPSMVLTLAGVALLFAAGATASRAGSRPEFDTVYYRLDSDTRTARWQSLDDAPDAYTERFLSENPAGKYDVAYFPTVRQQRFLDAPAPYLRLAPPQATVLSDSVLDGRRTLRLRIASARGAPTMSILVESKVGRLETWLGDLPMRGEDTDVLDGTPVRWALDYYAVPAAGVDLTLRFEASSDLKLRLIDSSYGLPAELGPMGLERPPGFMPGENGDGTLVSRAFDFVPR